MPALAAIDAPGPAKRVGYAFIALLGGNAALFLFILLSAIRARGSLLAMHMGKPGDEIRGALLLFAVYAAFSLVGWLLVGLPVVLLSSARSIARLSWPLTIIVGVALGPIAMFFIFVLLSRGHLDVTDPGTFKGTLWIWLFSMFVSTVSFAIYAGLLRRTTPADKSPAS
ncbi:MAG TPA: hypothetical protein VKS44_00685 [Candidatus Acidoferrales bacterium]|nr:hypothetical protein [Candidatus Acidoferrales bacterium]